MRLRPIPIWALLGLIGLLSILLNLVLLGKLVSCRENGILRAVHFDHARVFARKNTMLPAKDPHRPRVVLFGDSRVAQWNPLPADSMEVINRGISGEWTGQMRLRFAQDVLALKPDVLIIQAGINDLVAASRIDPEFRKVLVRQCIENLIAFANQGADQRIEVVFLSIFPPVAPPFYRLDILESPIWTLVDAVNGRLNQLRPNTRITLVDTQKVFLNPDGSWRAGVALDSLHLTAKGYELLNRNLDPILARVLNKR